MTIYQYYLNNGKLSTNDELIIKWNLGLIEYIHSNERTDNVMDMNKEGIFSIIGYYALSLSGTLYGNILKDYILKSHITTRNKKSVNNVLSWKLCLNIE